MPVLLFCFGLLAGGMCIFLLLAEKQRRLNSHAKRQIKLNAKLQTELRKLEADRQKFNESYADFTSKKTAFEKKAASYDELLTENGILKRDLQNIYVDFRKLQLDCEVQDENQNTLDKRARDLGSRYLKENVKWINSGLTSKNFGKSKQRLLKIIELCRGIGFEISKNEEETLLDDLKKGFEKAVRVEFEKEEQARIKAQIREEQRLQAEIDRELKKLERERAAIQAALDQAIQAQKDDEIAKLQSRLAEAEQKSQRAVSRAQLTKSGHVYVISNVGAFGESVFKIGMTRRLEPVDRVKELSNASVPFPFDVHMMISCDDAPALENTLHHSLHQSRLNKVNPRKEFFRTDIETIRTIVESNHGQVNYIADAEALQYRQSLEMSDEDTEFVESVYASLEEDEDAGQN